MTPTLDATTECVNGHQFEIAIGEKANIETGIATGRIRRRLDYLKARIENDKKELGKLEVNLANL